MRTRIRSFGVFSLSAIDLFASAMGAFIIISLILMPDYQKEVRLEGHFNYIEQLAREAEARLDESEQGMQDRLEALRSAQTLHQQMVAEQEIITSEVATLQARLANAQQPPPPQSEAEPVPEPVNSNQVTFRFLGLKTEKTKFLLMVDMNGYLGQYETLMEQTVKRALDSLQPGFEFGVMAFQQVDSGPRFMYWPSDGELMPVNSANRSQAIRFVQDLSGQYAGSSSLSAAFEEVFQSEAEAMILFSDGLPNPNFNKDLPPAALVRDITLSNTGNKEIHAVMLGDYFKYRGTVEFMESLARANAGGFLALAQ
ncbi:MAG TPA: hypothetical protein VJ984_07645 [Xanthomonadales bacterium]|nr:hypothetical protein [Xanthomonadales bacterium]